MFIYLTFRVEQKNKQTVTKHKAQIVAKRIYFFSLLHEFDWSLTVNVKDNLGEYLKCLI